MAEWFFIEQCGVMRCSSAIAVVDGRAWVARNNDTVAPGMWGYVGIREVGERIPTMTFGREGDIFVPTGINRERLWLHIGMLGDDEVERRSKTFATVYSNVACPHTGQIWYTFGGTPSGSRGDWQPVTWPF